MGSTRRSFTEEYKAKAVTFVIDDHRSIAEVARNIDVHEKTLGKWVKKARDEKETATPPDVLLDESSPNGSNWSGCARSLRMPNLRMHVCHECDREVGV
jgi:transposase